MFVPVMQVWRVRMCVCDRFVRMRVAVLQLNRQPRLWVCMPVMSIIVVVTMFVLCSDVFMEMLVILP